MNDVINFKNIENNVFDKSGIPKKSKLTTPKGGDVIGNFKEFPYIKIQPNNFYALLEGKDFKLTEWGEIVKI
jgi:CRISPR-associated endonuclease Csn1